MVRSFRGALAGEVDRPLAIEAVDTVRVLIVFSWPFSSRLHPEGREFRSGGLSVMARSLFLAVKAVLCLVLATTATCALHQTPWEMLPAMVVAVSSSTEQAPQT